MTWLEFWIEGWRWRTLCTIVWHFYRIQYSVLSSPWSHDQPPLNVQDPPWWNPLPSYECKSENPATSVRPAVSWSWNPPPPPVLPVDISISYIVWIGNAPTVHLIRHWTALYYGFSARSCLQISSWCPIGPDDVYSAVYCQPSISMTAQHSHPPSYIPMAVLGNARG